MKYGVIDSKGALIIPAKYQNIRWLGDDVFVVSAFEPHRMQYARQVILMNDRGDTIPISLAPGRTLAGSLSPMTEPVKTRSEIKLLIREKVAGGEEKLGVCDILGRVLLKPAYDEIKSFSDGYYTAIDNTKRCTFFIDADGKVTASIPLDEIDFAFNQFHEGFIYGKVTKSLYTGEPGGAFDLYRFLRPTGEQLKLPDLCWAADFSEGSAGVGLCDSERHPLYSALVTQSGEILTHKKYRYISSLHEGQAIVDTGTLKEPCYGVIDGKENVVIEPKYIYIKPCGNGYVATTAEGDVLIDHTGKNIVRYPQKITIYPSDTSVLMCSVSDSGSGSEGTSHIAYADREGHILDLKHWPSKTLVAPAWKNEPDGACCGLYSAKGWITKLVFQGFEPVSSDLWIVREIPREFDSRDWQLGIDRSGNFAAFLKEHDLIGMRREDVISILGLQEHGDDWMRYRGDPGMCANASQGFLIQFKNDRAIRWRLSDMISQMPFELSNERDWITKNVLFSPQQRQYKPKYKSSRK